MENAYNSAWWWAVPKKLASAKLKPETLDTLRALKVAWKAKSIDEVIQRLLEKAGVRIEVRLVEKV